jgi:hypothetical protein
LLIFVAGLAGGLAGVFVAVVAGVFFAVGSGVAVTWLLAFLVVPTVVMDRLNLQTAWPAYTLARTWLALHGQLPWPLMDFLADAHKRGVLRQSGGAYQFRHIELQHQLATRP